MIIYYQPPRHMKSCKIHILLTIYTSVNDGVMEKAFFVDVFTIEEPVSIIDYFIWTYVYINSEGAGTKASRLFVIARKNQHGKYYFSDGLKFPFTLHSTAFFQFSKEIIFLTPTSPLLLLAIPSWLTLRNTPFYPQRFDEKSWAFFGLIQTVEAHLNCEILVSTQFSHRVVHVPFWTQLYEKR